jgi:methionine aminotransferase
VQTNKLQFNSKLPKVETTIFTTVGNLARKHDAIDLSQGFPNFKADQELMQLVAQAMQDGHNQYAPMPGYFGLREVISQKMDSLHGVYYHPESEITVTVGATQAIFTAITAFIKQGDEVIVLKPAYDCYEPAIELNGGTPIYLELKAPEYAVDWVAFKALLTSKTKMVVINTPHNPSGRIFSKADMLQLQTLLRDTDIILISDEVYEHIVFDGAEHESVARFENLASRSFICASFGKTFHVTGWKMGYCAAPAPLMKEFRKVHQFNVFSVDHPTQRAMAKYLQHKNHYTDLNAFYQQKRDFFLKGVASSKFLFKPTMGTYFQLLDYSQITDEADLGFAKRLITDYKIASIPISSFNVDSRDDKVLRFCFAKKPETLTKALAVLNRL